MFRLRYEKYVLIAVLTLCVSVPPPEVSGKSEVMMLELGSKSAVSAPESPIVEFGLKGEKRGSDDLTGSGMVEGERYDYADDGTQTCYTWDSVNEIWVPQVRYTNIMGQGKLAIQLCYTWSGSSWDLQWEYLFAYAQQCNLVKKECKILNPAGGWTCVTRYTYGYDANGSVTYDTCWAFNSDGEWDTTRIIHYDYEYEDPDFPDKPSKQICYNRNPSTGGWAPNVRYIIHYDAEGRKSHEECETFTSSGWVLTRRYFYTYDDDGRLILRECFAE